MSIYNLTGTELSEAFSKAGEPLDKCYDLGGNVIFETGDYDHWDTEYQHSILIARDEWAEEYRADNTVLPIVLHTDQHTYLKQDFSKALFQYLCLAVNWDECAACVNLGDVSDYYDESDFSQMQTCLNLIPTAKQINIWGNHETWPRSGQTVNWATLQSYFDNSHFNGYLFQSGTLCNQSMIDSARGIKFVVAGCWDYDPDRGATTYNMDSDNIDTLISMLSQNDGNDIVFLSHIQPFTISEQLQADGTTRWYIPAVDGQSASSTTTSAGSMNGQNSIAAIFNARKAKTSGSVTDWYGNTHTFDFSNCTSDLLCCLHGHWHKDWYNWQGWSARDLPIIMFDALYYDNHPFYFVNINRTTEKVNVWKIDDTAAIYRYSVDFAQPVST